MARHSIIEKQTTAMCAPCLYHLLYRLWRAVEPQASIFCLANRPGSVIGWRFVFSAAVPGVEQCAAALFLPIHDVPESLYGIGESTPSDAPKAARPGH